jgi:hypothetical protein
MVFRLGILPRRGCKLECTMNGTAFLIAGGSLGVDGQSLRYENGVVMGVDRGGLQLLDKGAQFKGR